MDLKTVMYQSPEAHPGPSQAFKVNLYARIVDIIKLMLITIFANSTIMYVLRALIKPLTCSNAGNQLNAS